MSGPALPGCVSQGETVEEAVEHAKEAFVGWIACLVDDGEPVPVVVEVAGEAASSPLAAAG